MDVVFQGDRFAVQGVSIGRTALTFGVGLEAEVPEGVAVGLSYGFEGRADATRHPVCAAVKVAF